MRRALLTSLAALLLLAPAAAAQRHGFVTFPRDEHQHLDGWDYWWGSAELVTTSGARHVLGFAFNSHWGIGVTGHQLLPRSGPYRGRTITTIDGPADWGHPGASGRTVHDISVFVPGLSELLRHRTLDLARGGKEIGSLRRTRADRPAYALRLDNDEAKVHPTGRRVRFGVDLAMEMRDPPLLLGGTGRWWYSIPQALGYPSRSFQYFQAARRLTGTLTLEQPDGTVLTETIDPRRSRLVMVHEYDATPEDIPLGLGLAEATQLHPRYVPTYHSGMPWDLIFVDLGNGAQLMLAMLAFHETEKGTLKPLLGRRFPTYRTMATLRLPDGRSVALDDAIRVEHLDRRWIVGRTPSFLVSLTAVWLQSWRHRVSYPGGRVRAGDGSWVRVPPFDLGLVPALGQDEPASDDAGNRLTQRVPFRARGSYGGCPVRGFGWSELIVNFYGHEERDPWWTGGELPPVPRRCGRPTPRPGGAPGAVTPSFGAPAPPDLRTGACGASAPGPAPRCSFTARTAGGVAGFAAAPGGWTVTIHRPGRAEPLVVRSLGGAQLYVCGTIRPGDRVDVEARDAAVVAAGNPGVCF